MKFFVFASITALAMAAPAQVEKREPQIGSFIGNIGGLVGNTLGGLVVGLPLSFLGGAVGGAVNGAVGGLFGYPSGGYYYRVAQDGTVTNAEPIPAPVAAVQA